MVLFSYCVLCWNQLPSQLWEPGQEEIWSLEQTLVSSRLYWVHMSQLELSLMP